MVCHRRRPRARAEVAGRTTSSHSGGAITRSESSQSVGGKRLQSRRALRHATEASRRGRGPEARAVPHAFVAPGTAASAPHCTPRKARCSSTQRRQPDARATQPYVRSSMPRTSSHRARSGFGCSRFLRNGDPCARWHANDPAARPPRQTAAPRPRWSVPVATHARGNGISLQVGSRKFEVGSTVN